jgi:malonyl-ACP O-methyltransferase BioC
MKNSIKKNFSKAAKNYDKVAKIQKLAAKNLVEFVSPFIKKNHKILDLGSGTSFVAKNLFALKKNSEIFEIDLALEMLKSWRDRPKNIFTIQADFEKLPFKNSSFDIIISSFSLQWLEKNFDKNFADFFALLKPGGIFAFCLPSNQSLSELKSTKIFGFNQLPKTEDVKKTLKKCGFKEIFFEEVKLKQEFSTGLSALKSLKETGASHLWQKRKSITKKQLQEFNSFCLKNSLLKNKKFAVSWFIPYFISKKI